MKQVEAIKATKRPTKRYGTRITKRSSAWDTNVQGVGKYSNKAAKPLTRRQAYKLEKRALSNERLKINSKPEMIKQAGFALSQNLSPALTSYGTSAGLGKIYEAKNKTSEVNELIKGGINKAGTSNEEEEKASEDEAKVFIPR